MMFPIQQNRLAAARSTFRSKGSRRCTIYLGSIGCFVGLLEESAQQQRERMSSKVAGLGERNLVARVQGRSYFSSSRIPYH
ncbi:hypothetical protein [Microcoleus sp. herbarium19]|uniref:hypothetical protein n=1 Tax=Microcoleus sp. herbarium19 TaxID=3055440 RepID=UPI002FD19160